MNWTRLASYFGLKKPFDFGVAIPFLLNASVLSLVITAAFVLFVNGAMFVGTVRCYFFLYIATLLCIALIVSRVWIVSYVILFWCMMELGISILSSVISGPLNYLFPENDFTQPASDDGFMFHPLLQFMPKPNWTTTTHYDARARKTTNLPINWPALEKDMTFTHNSLGLRGAELTERDLGRNLVFLYGGSSTYDMTVTQGETWPERLQVNLNNHVTIVNLGVLGHGTTEHLIYTAFYQNMLKRKPVCAVYYTGWNDVRNSHKIEHDAAYANYQLLIQAHRKPGMRTEQYSPTLRLVSMIARGRFDSIPQPPRIDWSRVPSGPDLRLEELFVEHLRTIAAINHARNIKTVLIAQLLNREYLAMLKPGPADDFFYLMNYKGEGMWALQERLNALMEQTARSVGAKYINVGVEKFHYSDFIDHVHFSSAGSAKFAALISSDVDSYCR